MSFFEELKRRNVIRVAIAYAAVAWLLLQVADVLLPAFGSPPWVMTAFATLLILSFPVALILAWAFELTPDGVKRDKDVGPGQSIAHLTGRKLDFIIIAVLVLAVGFLAADKFFVDSDPASQPIAEKSVAVLPFVNMSDDASNEYFSDGVSEEILNSLARVKDLQIAGRTSSFAFKSRTEDLRTIGETLGVSYILDGSVRKAGSNVRITAQLVEAESGYQLWSETYDRELTDIFAIQDEIAAEILNQLKASLLDTERENLVTQRTDSDVYELYLLAKQRIYNRTPQSIESATALLDQALEKDPDYAPAYAQRGIAEMLLADDSYGTIPRDVAYPRGKSYLDVALELNPLLAEAWAGLGLYYTNQPTKFEQAVAALEKALQINPNLLDAGNWMQIALISAGRFRAALQVLEKITQKDPLYLPGFGNAMRLFDEFGQEDKAQALIDHYRNYDPNNLHLLHLDADHQLHYGRAAKAVQLAERSLAGGPSDVNARLALGEALLQTLQIKLAAKEGSGDAKVIALYLTGRRNEAFELARSLVEIGQLKPLFWLFNRTGRSADLVDYVRERWSGLDELASGYRYDPGGYALMAEVALAYDRAGDSARSGEALTLVEDAMSYLSAEGIDNWRFMYNNAAFLALAGRYDEAITQLEKAARRGMLLCTPLARLNPEFEALRNDSRLAAIEAGMTENVNAERQALGLDPVDPASHCWTQAAEPQ